MSSDRINLVPEQRFHARPAVVLTALVTMLHLSVLAGRLGKRALPADESVFAWQAANVGAPAEAAREESSSNPIRSYSAGQLSLNTGIAVVALTAWLRVMRVNGAHGR